MRTSLFLSTLIAVSLIGGSALAEKTGGTTAREPRALEHLRAHGDTVDKSYSAPERLAARGGSAGAPSTRAPAQQPKQQMDRGASRVNCSDTGIDCLAAHGKAPSAVDAGTPSQAGRVTQAPAFLDKILGSDRTNFNEAGEDQGMSSRAVKRAWSHAAGSHAGAGAGAAVPLAVQQQVDRLSQQRSEARMSCNEADECSMSIKAARKEWAGASIKAGTWSGPAATPISNAERRIAAERAAVSAAHHDELVAHAEAEHPTAGHAGGAHAAPAGDHQH